MKTIYEKCLDLSIKKGWVNDDEQRIKVVEEANELLEAKTEEEISDEIADILFALNPIVTYNLGTTYEALLQRALDKNLEREINPNYKR